MNSAKANHRTGLFGGSFDPPHLGHVALVEAGLRVMGLDEVFVIPALPVHRTLSGCADGATRLRWLEMIFDANSRVSVLDWEVRRRRPTATVDTLREFADKYPSRTPWLMLGADAWAGMAGWRQYPAHAGLCNAAVFSRRGMDRASAPELADWEQVDLRQWRQCRGGGHMLYVDVELPDISATTLRTGLMKSGALGDSIPTMIAKEVQQAYAGRMEQM